MNVINPKLWASVNANEGALRTFRYARWKSITYRVVVQSNPFVFGYFTLTCLPNDKRRHNNSLALSDHGWFSHDDCLIVDITSMPESRITVPWLSNNTWVDLEKWANGTFNVEQTLIQLNGLKILYDNTINVTNSAVPKAFSISVFMKFEGVEVSGPISPGATHEAQMDVAATFIAGAAGSAFEKHAKAGVEKLVEKGFSAAETYAAGLFGGEEGVGAEFGVTSEEPASPAVLAHSVEEGSADQPQEVIPSVFGGMNYSCSRNVLGTGTMVLTRARQNSLSEFLQKPSLIGRTNLVSATGFVFQPDVWNGRDVYSYFTNIATCSRLRYLAQFYRFWRGSVTYTFFFISSPMVTFRLKVGLDYQGGTLAGIDPGDTLQQIITVRGTTVHQVTVPYLYTTPWQFLGDGDPFDVDVIPTISVSEFSPASKSGDVVPSFYLLVYESANRDFVFTSQEDPMPYAASPPLKLFSQKEKRARKLRHEAQMDIRKFRSQDATQFGSCDPVKFTSDGVGTFEGMAKRWSARPTSSLSRGAYDDRFPYETQPYVSQLSTMDALKGIFYWNRGQYKLKVSFDADPDTVNQSAVGIVKMQSFHPVSNDPDAGIPAPVRFPDGATAISFGLTQVIECTIPFLCTTEWVECVFGFTPTTGARPLVYQPEIWAEGATEVPLNFVAVAAGRDFCYSYNLPPPYFGARWYDCVPYSPVSKSTSSTPSANSSGASKSLRKRA